MRASRRSHTTVSYGWTPGSVKNRRIPIPICSGAMAMWPPPTWSFDVVRALRARCRPGRSGPLSSGPFGPDVIARVPLDTGPNRAPPAPPLDPVPPSHHTREHKMLWRYPDQPRDGGQLHHRNYPHVNGCAGGVDAGRRAFAKVRTRERPHAPPGSGCGTRLRRRRLLEHPDLPLEVAQILEPLVHGREAHVRHRVEGPQALEHRQADLLARHLGPRTLAQLLLDVRDDRVDGRVVDGPVLRGARDPRRHLRTVERLARAGALHDEERHLFHALVRREPSPARQALAPAPDRGAFVSDPGVDDLVVERVAERAPHRPNRTEGVRATDGAEPGRSGALTAATRSSRREPTARRDGRPRGRRRPDGDRARDRGAARPSTASRPVGRRRS